MSNATEADLDTTILTLEGAGDNFVAHLRERLLALRDIPAEFETLRASLASASMSPVLLSIQIVLTVMLVSAAFFLLARYAEKRLFAGTRLRSLLSILTAAIVILAIGFTVSWLVGAPGLHFRTLRLWTVLTVVGCCVLLLVRVVLAPRHPGSGRRPVRLLAFTRDLSIAICWAILGISLVSSLQLWSAGPALKDLTRTALVGLPAYLLLAWAVWRHRRTMAAAVAGPRPRSRWRSRLARSWPVIVIALLALTFVSAQTALTLGTPLPGFAVMLTILIFVATPHLDATVVAWAQRGLESPGISILATAGRQTVRFAILIIAIAMLGTVWATPLALGLGFDIRSVTREALQIALIALIAAFLWNVVGTMTARSMYDERRDLGDDEAAVAPRSRLGTVVPLISGIGKSSILALALLSMLVSVGVNVWPLITGLSVFGLAIGFGSQTLVKDVVSGLFFLIDDAFRFGEYIETSGAKGTVEKISIRSVSLRNSRGSISTVPYGQIGKIQNFSRDWAIEKLAFRVAFDTDVELVRKLFKKIGQEIAADPELAPDLIEPFKSQGIGEVEDGTLVIKAKFTAKPGRQSMIRRAVLIAVQNAFRENNIHAVPKPLAGAQPEAAG